MDTSVIDLRILQLHEKKSLYMQFLTARRLSSCPQQRTRYSAYIEQLRAGFGLPEHVTTLWEEQAQTCFDIWPAILDRIQQVA